MNKVILVLICFIVFNGLSQEAEKNIMIREQKCGVKNIPCYIMYFTDSKHRIFEIIKINNQDYPYELTFDFSYRTTTANYVCYTLYDQVVGSSMSIFFDKRHQTFFKSEWYDLKALGDKIIKNTVDFDRKQLFIEPTKSNGNKRQKYKIQLTSIKLNPTD